MLFLTTYNEHKEELVELEQNYIKSQKKLIRDETQRALRYIIHKHKTADKNSDLKVLQDEIVETIEHMRDIRNGSGYIFIYTFEGINIADPILKHNAGKNLIDFTDPNGKLVIKELIDISKQDSGGFVTYVWNKPITNVLTNKISYASSYRPWNWMIGSGVYLDDIENVIKNKKEQYLQKILKYIIQISIFAFILFLSSIIVSRYFTHLISKDIQRIQDTLRNVSASYNTIDIDSLTFKEFKQIALNINLMINELRELNTKLEDKVDSRTIKLKKSEKFALKLFKDQDKFIKNAIHEINTPLSIIITNIDLFKLKVEDNRYLSKIEAGSKIIHNIYNDLAYLVKKDRIEYPKEQINFSQFLSARIDFFDEIASGNHIEINHEIEENVYIDFNETQLQRICDNSLSNAIKYSYQDTCVNIVLKIKKNTIVLSIENSGDDIKNTDKLFKRFYREDEARGGFGLGLNIIKEICGDNDVDIKVTSKDRVTKFVYSFGLEKNENITT